MFLALWEYEVKSGCEERFESAYGPGGDWARLFGSDSNYRFMGTFAVGLLVVGYLSRRFGSLATWR